MNESFGAEVLDPGVATARPPAPGRRAVGPPARGRIVVPVSRHPVLWLTAFAVALRLLLFLGRGDYVAFDESWYLILGHNLWSGRGFTLSGLRQVALSPLFPLFAGAAGKVLGSAVWGGRVVAAVASGLLVLPCWGIFRPLAGRRTALLACAIVAVLPSLAPFVAPEWVGWDLWNGAGPLFHLFLYGGIALLLAALRRDGSWPGRGWLLWAGAGALFGLGFLDRPEAMAAGGLAGLAAWSLRPGRLRRLAGAALCALAFLVVTAPYLLYLRDTLGHWTLSGRGVYLAPASAARVASGAARGSPANLEDMLWEGKQAEYAVALYRLHPSLTRMNDAYWGVPPRDAPGAVPAGRTAPPASSGGPPGLASSAARAAAPAVPAAAEPTLPARALRRAGLYAAALGMVLPWFLWPFVAAGVLVPGRPGRRKREELIAFGPPALTSAAIALFVAIDPRTQIFLAPALAWYAARGLRLSAGALTRRAGAGIRRGFVELLVGGIALTALVGVDAWRLWMGVRGETVHQVIGSANREVGGALRALVPAGASVMSWNPAPAAWAGRDWRPLPIAPLRDVLTFATVTRTEWIVFSTLNPSPLPRAQMPKAFVIARVAPGAATASRWVLSVDSMAGQHAIGVLAPADSTGATWPR